ncbi:hypothetical protein LV716_04920 [Flagellimonas sp. HMM57]|uniref:hypothetical protein n=1 Tax=unclassified Flagellimonas TaxID=2644544 RepID=UPI0013D58F42|nr:MULTISPECIES: hypothetical protein [unclassified Flagellimonas]UII77134.1 hypothetical protein LV716_04920 [Flagellimonas sp. HMM57]
MLKKLLFPALTIFYLTTNPYLNAQQTNTDFVYAGVGIRFIMQMERIDYTILFRKDGTFCEDLHEIDWQTKVNGRYKETNTNIIMEYLDKTIENDTIVFEGDKSIGDFYGTQVIRMEPPNKVPSGYYSFSSASNSGGMGTGMTYVGTQRHEGFNFYNNGTFNKSTSGAVIVSGNNVAGGTSSDNVEKGKYTIKNGLLTLSYDNGKVEKSSFFYDSSETDDFMVVIDGNIFFYGEEDEGNNAEKSTANTSDKNTSLTKEDKMLGLLRKAKQAHGGKYIDALQTVKTEFTVSGIPFRGLMDADKSFVRLESLSPTFPYIEQLEGNTGWIYKNGRNQQMPKERVAEIKLSFASGIFGLRDSMLEKAIIKDSQESDDYIVIALEIGEAIVGYTIDNQNHKMLASFSFKNGKKEITYMSNFRKTGNLLLPFTEKTETSEGNIEVKYDNYEINPALTTKDWAKPN